MLENIRIVLVNTTEPGNIGAAARAMKTMGLKQLYLVNPRKFPHPKASSRASQAVDILENATICQSLDEAITDCEIVMGASSRSRSIAVATFTPREAAEKIAHMNQAKVAILFGRESDGLSNEELDRCQFLMTIPTSAEYAALNVASAVQVIAYELHLMALSSNITLKEPPEKYATPQELENLWKHLNQTLIDIQFMHPNRPGLVMRRLQRLLLRAHPTQREVKMLRGILTAVNKISNL